MEENTVVQAQLKSLQDEVAISKNKLSFGPRGKQTGSQLGSIDAEDLELRHSTIVKQLYDKIDKLKGDNEILQAQVYENERWAPGVYELK